MNFLYKRNGNRGSVSARPVTQRGQRKVAICIAGRFQRHLSSDNPTYLAERERVYEGMRLAGVPEG